MTTCPPRTRRRASGWTPERRAAFLDALRATGTVRAACAAVGLSRAGAYLLRDRCPDVAAEWDAAIDCHQEALLQEAICRATEGSVRPVTYRGRIVGERVVYSDRLLIAALYRGRANVGDGI